MQRFAPTAIEVAADDLLRLNGYKDLAKVKAPVRAGADYAAAEVAKLTAPAAHYRHMTVASLDGDTLGLADGPSFRCEGFAGLLPGCVEAVVFALTAGGRLDDEVRALSDRFDLMEALFLETAGWLVMEATTKQFAALLREDADTRGLRLIRRLEPGVTYKLDGREALWPIADMAPLFDLWAGDELPVRLGSGNVLAPKMSRAGLYGIAAAA